MKNFFLFLSKNPAAVKTAKKHGLKFGASRFVSGETLHSALQVIEKLNAKNMMATLDHLGEFVNTEEEAKFSTQECIEALKTMSARGVQANLSLKLTQIGLDISNELVLQNMRSILQVAKETGNFVRIDMEDYSRNEKTLTLFKALKEEFPTEVGTVIQAYLYKSLNDVMALNTYKPNLRICKGAYKESQTVAFPDKRDVDITYVKMVKKHLQNGNYAAIATHDGKIIQELISYIEENQIPRTQFEFQMLYGIQNELLEELAQKGYQTRVYVPYGRDWYGYFMRRLAERPANVWFVLKNMKKSK